MTTTPQAICEALEAHLRGRTGWDQPPAVFTLHHDGDGIVMAQVPVPEGIWALGGHPPTVLAHLASVFAAASGSAFQQLLTPAGLRSLAGVAFFYEGYALHSGMDSPAAQEVVRRQKAGGSMPRFETVPGRLEQLHHRRGRVRRPVHGDGHPGAHRPAQATEPEAHHIPADDGGERMTGAVVTAVNRFLHAVRSAATTPGGTFGKGTPS